MKIISLKEKMKLFKNEQLIKMKRFVLFVKTNLNVNILKVKIIVKLGTIVIIQGNTEVLHLAYLI